MSQTKKPAILIVEDERIVAKDLQQTLAGMGYDAYAIASSATEAITRCAEKCPDLVLMDIRIKGRRDGIETAGILRQQFGVPIIYITAHGDDATLERAKKTEPYGYLLKPVKAVELRSAIEVTLFRHEMELRRFERERGLSTTLHSMADAVVTVDLGGRITFLNAAAESLLGIKTADAVGRPAHEVVQMTGWETVAGQNPQTKIRHTHNHVEIADSSLHDQRIDDQQMHNDVSASSAENKSSAGAVMVFRNVTEQRRLQQQAELSDRLASLSTLAAGVAHEINNPLAVVVASAGLLVEDLTDHRSELAASIPRERLQHRLEDMVDTLRDLQSAADRIRRIVSDLHVFSQPSQQKTPGRADLRRCVESALRATAHEFRHRARLTTHFDPVPTVHADEAKLGQVLVNLLRNAAHAIAPGNFDQNEVSLSIGRDAQGQALLEVRDTGTGIPKEIQNRIFEPFFTTKEAGLGMGLGLSICHGIIRSIGGKISFDSETNKGTVFRVVLPASVPSEANPFPAAIHMTNSQKGRILVVDDEELIRKLIPRILSEHEVRCTSSAQEALDLLDSGEHFELIISDLVTPGMTGMKFYEALLGRDPELARRVIFLSGGAVTPQVNDFLQSVPNRIIEKPFEAKALVGTVQEFLAHGADAG